jgi:hypothetical protein
MFRNERPSIMKMSFVSKEDLTMDSQNEIRRAGWRSVIAVALTTVAITFNHVFTLGGVAFLLGATLLVSRQRCGFGFAEPGTGGHSLPTAS